MIFRDEHVSGRWKQDMFTPAQISLAIGRRLILHDCFYIEVYDDESCERETEETVGEYKDRLEEFATESFRQFSETWSDNPFRAISKLNRNHSFSYFWDISLTDCGERAYECYKQDLCCDRNGRVDREGTINYWLGVLSKNNVLTNLRDNYIGKKNERTSGFRSDYSWIYEPWAERLYVAMKFAKQGLMIDIDGTPLYEETLKYFNSYSDPTLRIYSKEILAVNADWIVPFQEKIMHIIFTEEV